MESDQINRLDEYSRQKAKEVFSSLPYRAADQQEYKNFVKKRKRTGRVTPNGIIDFAINAAAILFLPLLLFTGYFFYNSYTAGGNIAQLQDPVIENGSAAINTDGVKEQESSWIEYVINPGVKGKILLPCGSEVWVNSKSHIKCPATFASDQRRVMLSGEAYFKVKSNKDWPMRIETPQGVTAMVLGTELNITAYEDDPSVKVTLVNGQVEVHKKVDSNEKIILKPFEEIEIFCNNIAEDKKELDTTSVNNISAWKEGYLIFSNTPMDEVIKIMERWYGVNFNPIDDEIAKFNFTARFKTESLTQILDLLSISSNIKYSIKGNTVTLFR